MKTKLTLFVLISCLLMTTTVLGQTKKSYFPIMSIFVENGVLFPSNDSFKEFYNSKSYLNYGVGFCFGSSNWSLLPWIKLSEYNAHYKFFSKEVASYILNDARRRQLAFGFVNPIKLKNTHYAQLKCGASYNHLQETSTDFNNFRIGYIMSVGYLNRLTPRFSFYADCTYDYVKNDNDNTFKDWGGLLINFGLSYNIAKLVKHKE